MPMVDRPREKLLRYKSASRLKTEELFAIILGMVVWLVEPPESITGTSPIQLLAFFLPLLLFLTFSINLYFKSPVKSLGISVGIIVLLMFQSLGVLNVLSGAVTIAVIAFLIKWLKKTKQD